MVGSPFIQLIQNGRVSVLNVHEIAFVYQENFDLRAKEDRVLYRSIMPEQGMLYTIQFMLTSRREMEMVYTTEDDRDEMFAKIIAAMSPGVVIETNYTRPAFKPKLADDDPEKTYTRDEVFLTREEYDLAVQAGVQRALQAEKVAQATQSPPPPTPNPPRKPRTPRQ